MVDGVKKFPRDGSVVLKWREHAISLTLIEKHLSMVLYVSVEPL